MADAWLPDLVRPGGLERHLGDGGDRGDLGCGDREGAAEEAGAAAAHVLSAGHLADGRDDPDAGRVVLRVAGPPGGLLADVPFALEWHVPTEKVVTDWRVLVPADVMESVFREAVGPLVSDGEPSAVLRAAMAVFAADGNAGEPRGHAGEPGDVSAARAPRSRTARVPRRSRSSWR